jgi:hypothetical protein
LPAWIWVAHTWPLLALCAIFKVAYIAKGAMYAPPIVSEAIQGNGPLA